MTRPAYAIAVMKVTDPERFAEYVKQAPAHVKACGGEYLSRGGRHETIEGDWQWDRISLVRFPSYEQAKAFYEGIYKEVSKLRLGATDYFNIVLMEGLDEPIL